MQRAEMPQRLPPPRRRYHYGATTAGIVLIAAGVVWILDVAGLIEVQAALILPGLLAVVGLALIVGSMDGPHPGLVIFGVFLTVAVVAAAVAPPNAFRGGIGERHHRIESQADLARRYDVGLGDLTLDLRDLTLTESAEVEVTVGAGEMRIVLPDDIEFSIDASVGAGDIDLLGERSDGVSVSRTYESPGYDAATTTLTLDLDVAAGSIEVRR